MPIQQNNSFQKSFWLIFSLAFAVRVIYDFFLQQNYFFYHHPGSDSVYYQDWARRILKEGWIGTETFYGLPLYPYFLAVVERSSFGMDWLVKASHITLGSLNCALLSVITKILFEKKTAILTGILSAVSFTFFYYDTITMPVTLEVFISLAVIYYFLNQNLLMNARQWLLFGLIIGVGILGDGKLMFVSVLVLIFWHFTKHPAYKNVTTTIFPMVLGICLIVMAVGVRNKIVGGSWVLISAQSGLSFYVGNNPRATGLYEHPDNIRPTHGGQDEDQVILAEQESGRSLTDAQVSQFWRQKGFDFIQNNSQQYLVLLAKKIGHFMSDEEASFDVDMILMRELKKWMDWNPFYLMFPWAILGFIVSRRSKNLFYVDAMIVSQLIFTLIFFSSYRHRATIMPFLFMYQAVGIFWLIEQILNKKFTKVGVAVIFLIGYVVTLPPRALKASEYQFLSAAKRGPVYEKRKEFVKAREEYQKALEIRPRDTNALYNLANSYILEKRFAESIVYYNEVLAVNPHHVDALYNAAVAFEELHQMEAAVDYYRRAIALQPAAIDVRYRLGMIFQKQNKCQQSAEQFKLISQLAPQYGLEVKSLINACR
jgi:tetratricopeptide (TPR) repeat protein